MARVDPSGEVAMLFAENVSVSQERLRQIVADIPLSESGDGILKEHNLRYMAKSEGSSMKIAFIDLTDDIAATRNALLASVVFCVIALAAFLFISLYLSRWALQPVERAWAQQRRFIADASHELKTPLTVILANTGILRANRSSTVEQQMNWVDNTEAEASRMKKLVDNLLFLARADGAETPLAYSVVNLSDVFVSTALAFESVAFERGISLETMAISPDLHISGNEVQLGQLIGILLDNAAKYAKEGSVVTLSLEARQAKAALTVHNDGSYLPPNELAHIFDRFYRADQSRSAEGYGLGLSIAQSIVEAHAGKISARSDVSGGTDFTVLLPLYDGGER